MIVSYFLFRVLNLLALKKKKSVAGNAPLLNQFSSNVLRFSHENDSNQIFLKTGAYLKRSYTVINHFHPENSIKRALIGREKWLGFPVVIFFFFPV